MYLFVSPRDISYVVFGLFSHGKIEKETRVESRPEEILGHITAFLTKAYLRPEDLKGLIVVTGPGSFTSLRAGVAIINTFAFVEDLPVIGVENPDDLPLEELLSKTDLSNTKPFTLPEYGREPNITQAKN